MPRVQWALQRGRPCVQVVLSLAPGGQPFPRTLLADTGAGSRAGAFELVLDEGDCLLCGAITLPPVALLGAYAGRFPIYELRVQVPTIGFAKHIRAVGVPSLPGRFDGMACFGFLNRFTYGNFGDPGQFGLES
jgi:hypothetical protein